MPLCPVNQRMPWRSKVAVFRLASGDDAGSGKRRTRRVFGSTRTIAFSPPSVIHGAPSGPTMTPCGAEPVSEGGVPRLAGLRVEPAELAGSLRRVPDASVARRRDIVRAASRRDGILADGGRCGRARSIRRGTRESGETATQTGMAVHPRIDPVCPAGLEPRLDRCRVGAPMPATARIALTREARAAGRAAGRRPPAETARLWADVLGKVPLFAGVPARHVRKIASLGSVARFEAEGRRSSLRAIRATRSTSFSAAAPRSGEDADVPSAELGPGCLLRRDGARRRRARGPRRSSPRRRPRA